MIIKEDVVKNLLNMEDCIKATENGYLAYGQNNAVLTTRVNLWLNPNQSIKIGAAALISQGYMGSFSYSAGFGKKGTNPSTTILYDAKSGQLLAFIESQHLKWFRTGATAAVAAKYLARKHAHTIGVMGVGRQAKTQLLGLNTVLDLSTAKVFSPSREHREQYAREMSKDLGLNVIPVDNSRSCVTDVDIVITCSTSKQPVFDGAWIRDGIHINVIGAHTPTTREVDTNTVRRSKVVVEWKEQALEENGNLLIPMKEGAFGTEKITAELGEVVSGKVMCRTQDSDNTMFLSGGVALDQIAIASHVYEIAKKSGAGIEVKLST